MWTRDQAREPSPEHEVLVECARLTMDAASVERFRGWLRSELHWDRLIGLADWHGLLPLLHRHVEAAGSDCVPPGIADRLDRGFQENARRNLVLAGELLKILDRFAANGIVGVPFKGPTLAAVMYGDLGGRVFGDLDVLVKPRDVPRATELLVVDGYRPRFALSRDQEAAFLNAHYEAPFVREPPGVVVELQWRVVPRYLGVDFDYGQMWDRVGLASLLGRPIPCLSREDLLLVLCVHGTKHLWVRLGWVCDVAATLRACPGLDVDYLLDTARLLGIRRALALGVVLAQTVSGVSGPPGLLGGAEADDATRRLAVDVRNRAMAGEGGPPRLIEERVFHLRARERWRDRATYCWRLVAMRTPGDVTFLTLPGWLAPLYLPLRFLRLAVKYGSRTGRWLGPRRGGP